MSTFIYTLLLRDNKYYIGKSANPIKRVEDHVIGTTPWTTLHPPIKVLEMYQTNNKFEEDNKTKEYMDKFGIENVRGGSYTTVQLSNQDRRALQKELYSADDRCHICGKKGHFCAKCPDKGRSFIMRDDMPLDNDDECDSGNDDDSYMGPQFACYRCGRTSHYANNCYATTDIYGNLLE